MEKSEQNILIMMKIKIVKIMIMKIKIVKIKIVKMMFGMDSVLK